LPLKIFRVYPTPRRAVLIFLSNPSPVRGLFEGKRREERRSRLVLIERIEVETSSGVVVS
jgi:hypothetical protein